MMFKLCGLLAVLSIAFVSNLNALTGKDHQKLELLVVTVATSENDAFRLFKRSVEKYNLNLKVFGMGVEWRGGTMKTVGGGHKVNLLKEGLKPYQNKKDLLIMFVDSYDVVFTAGVDAILEKFFKLDAGIVFAAEDAIWPDKSLESKYPKVKENEKRFLNSGGFIGYAPNVYEMVTYQLIEDEDDDQLFYTQIFLNRALRHQQKIKLDTRAEIFQNLHLALGEVVLKYKGEHSFLYNMKTGTSPIVVHGNGPIKPEFFRLANYLADGWTNSAGCLSCKEDLLDISTVKDEDLPTVMIAIFIEYPTPYIKECLERIQMLDYPRNKIDLFIHNDIDYHTKDLDKFLLNNERFYASTRYVSADDNVEEGLARNRAIEECINKNCQYLFTVDSIIQITNPSLLKDLITQNRSIVAPLMTRHLKPWSNFWGALGQDGFYARSEDYMDIVEGKRVGLWNVPFISHVMLIQGQRLHSLRGGFTYNYEVDPDMSFCEKARDQKVFMYVSNRKYWGHQVNAEGFDTSHLNNELFNIFSNQLDWENRYIHKDYSKALEKDIVIDQPCPDVYWFPIVTDTFCDEFVAEFENFGKWSGGKNEDPRLAGGYENVPTVDIHMKQVGLERQWLHFLKVYVRPLQEKVFTGYFHNPPEAIMNFIVRYRPDEQPLLRPHHDASTYTINIALNRVNVDYEGGGCRFIRYNCSITAPKKGWMFMHPGRLTHYHEGLRTTKGTRYIMISFVDP